MRTQMMHKRWLRKLASLSSDNRLNGWVGTCLAGLLNRIKFELKKRHGLVLTVDHVSLFCGRIGVSGWALSQTGRSGIASIEVSVDGTAIGNATYGDSRSDVYRLYPFIPQSEQSGFHLYADLPDILRSDLNDRQIRIKALGRDGNSYAQCYPLENTYDAWMIHHEPNRADLETQQQTGFPYEPTISLLVPTYQTPTPFLQAMIASVRSQTYAHWELCIADGASQDRALRNILETCAQQDRRIKVTFLPENRGIAGNSNAALALATGDFVGLLDHDDTLAPFALFETTQSINAYPQADYLYSDEDRLSEDGSVRYEPHFKPDWSPDTLRSTNYPTHFSVFRKSLLEQLGGLREGFEGSQDYDLILRATEQARQIVHIPKVLYHWRVHNQSLARDAFAKETTYQAAQKALQAHLERLQLPGNVEDAGLTGYYQVKYLIRKSPKVSIIIPNHDHADDLKRCIDSIVHKSSYRRFEILLVENGSSAEETLALYERFKRRDNIRILEWSHPFNYSAVNNFAANKARGEVLLFLNNDTEVINADWLERMLEHAVRPDVGAVGAKLYYPDHTIQHAGLILGLRNIAGHSFKSFPGYANGYMGQLRIIRNVSAVTAACLMVRKDVFQAVRGFDEGYQLAYNDLDLCLRIRAQGYVIVWTPYAELYHFESKTRGYEDTRAKQARFQREKELFQHAWQAVLQKGDPYYNPNLTLEREDFSIRVPEQQNSIFMGQHKYP